ncbi:exosortase-associated protein EpsI, B-type [Denitromonas ohlonensis]|uniref:EpsI family protein n=2 Tax=Denitromonas TaxID=139331 RepID=A0A557SKR8_9RHOO|nr:exosortase-associated protein EpsI, B-type [Denitromonas ohlonensis]TVO68102.1 EpsI family protein [Denitromonas ohlonensis]TVO77993.1 EpsI family protein [Denitromonas ohlonensis]
MKRTSLVLLALMILSVISAHALTPTIKLVEQNGKPNLEEIVPDKFGSWALDPNQVVAVVNPVQEENIKRVYDQTLSRTYLRPDGYRIMLSIAYGADQRSGEALGVHYPEVCYPAQGFEVVSNSKGSVSTDHSNLPVRRLETKLGTQRKEPVTYWTTLGEYLTLGGLDRRLIELRYGLKGEIPDGLLFRVSSIDNDSPRAFDIHERFIKELLQQLPERSRVQLAGSGVQ